jgi:hypothetical protein
MSIENEADLIEMLKADPGNPLFASFAESLRQEGRHQEAMAVCFTGLSANPSCHGGRLVLARCFYERGELLFTCVS